MGSVVSTLFGGSQSKTSSDSMSQNVNNDYLKNALGGQVTNAGNANMSMAALLGQGGDKAGADAAFQNYLGSSGYNFMMDQGQRGITGSAAARGLLGSGSTLKGLTQFGQNLGSTTFNNYLGQLGSLVSAGQGSMNTLAAAGQQSKSTSRGSSSENKGLIPGIASIAAMAGGI